MGRVAKVLVQKLLRAVEKQGLKNRVWPHLVSGWKKTRDPQTPHKEVRVGQCLAFFLNRIWGT